MLALLLLACAEEPAPTDFDAPGPWPVGARTVEVRDDARGRALEVEVWYPAAEAGPGAPVTGFLADAERAGVYDDLLRAAPPGCPTHRSGAARDAAVAEGAWPLVVFSHCKGCLRFSSFTVAEHLASHGFVVAAPDHAGDTLWDSLAGEALPLSAETLAEVRGPDLAAVLDAGVAGALGVAVEPGQLGVLGHSFGAVTAGWLAQSDPRVAAGVFMAAPVDTPIPAGVEVSDLSLPMLFLLMREDNSISELGNTLIRQNAEEAGGPARVLEVDDAGHWSVSDLVGLTEGFMPGCGEDLRQTDPDLAFTYLDPAEGRDLAAAAAAASLSASLRGDAAGEAWIGAVGERAGVTITGP